MTNIFLFLDFCGIISGIRKIGEKMEKLRVVYSKSKEAIFLSHLDMIRVFETALARADILVEHTNGFNPRPELVFAHPLSVGIESTGEIFEVNLVEKLEIPYFIRQLNRVLPSGITVLSAEYVEGNEKNIMSRVYAATYIIDLVYQEEKLNLLNKREIEDLKDYYQKKMLEYLSQENILVLKKSKDRMERIDIKPQIIVFDFFLDRSLEITVSTGSRENLKPDLIMNGYQEYINEDILYHIKRTKILYH